MRHVDLDLRKEILILGVILLVIGIGTAGYFGWVPSTHTLRFYGAYGLAVIGAIFAAAGAMMGPSSMAAKTGQFTCQKCGANFGTQGALDQHTKAKHPTETANTTSTTP